MQQLTPNVFTEVGFAGSNVSFVVTAAGLVLVDTPQRPSDAVKWRTEAQSRGNLCYLINTENHGDHIIGNYFFPTTVVAQEGTRALFAESLGPIEQLKQRLVGMDPEAAALVGSYEPRPPSITFSDRLTLYAGDHTFQLMHLPGHTPNEAVVYVPEEKALFTGDNITCQLPAFFQQGVHPSLWIESLKKLQNLDVAIVVPGHGEVCGKEGIAEMIASIEEMTAAVRQAKAAGMSKEEVGDKVSTLERYPIPAGIAGMYRQLHRVSMMKIYDYLDE